jgi:hypothetical protein
VVPALSTVDGVSDVLVSAFMIMQPAPVESVGSVGSVELLVATARK